MGIKSEKPKLNKAKKRLLIIVASVIFVLVLLIIASVLIDKYEAGKKTEIPEADFDFYEPNYDEDIYTNEEYIAKISGGFIKYSKDDVTLGITRESASGQGIEVEFIVETLYDIINGDNTSYNERFSEEYYKNHAPKDKFTMQMIYDVKITYMSTENVDDGNYTKSVYAIEYRILNNNGTFRRDIGSGSRVQYIILTDRAGEVLIDDIITPTNK
jgi:hypothetical protein